MSADEVAALSDGPASVFLPEDPVYAAIARTASALHLTDYD